MTYYPFTYTPIFLYCYIYPYPRDNPILNLNPNPSLGNWSSSGPGRPSIPTTSPSLTGNCAHQSVRRLLTMWSWHFVETIMCLAIWLMWHPCFAHTWIQAYWRAIQRVSRGICMQYCMQESELYPFCIRYISHLIGHEGAGSIYAEIKRRGWATSLGSSPYTDNRTFSTYFCTITLTEEGL